VRDTFFGRISYVVVKAQQHECKQENG